MPESLLNRLVTRATLYRAFQRVWENGGCRGSDGVTVGRFRDRLEWELDSISDSLIRRCYRPLPLLRFPVRKAGGSGLRHLSVPTVRDRVVKSAVYLVTKDRFEAEFEDSSFQAAPPPE
jgi:retron-type reverse transcriptase